MVNSNINWSRPSKYRKRNSNPRGRETILRVGGNWQATMDFLKLNGVQILPPNHCIYPIPLTILQTFKLNSKDRAKWGNQKASKTLFRRFDSKHFHQKHNKLYLTAHFLKFLPLWYQTNSIMGRNSSQNSFMGQNIPQSHTEHCRSELSVDSDWSYRF